MDPFPILFDNYVVFVIRAYSFILGSKNSCTHVDLIHKYDYWPFCFCDYQIEKGDLQSIDQQSIESQNHECIIVMKI